jgi:hypothetical protein
VTVRQRKCAALTCQTLVPPRLLMCRRHWSLVPVLIRNRVWAHYQKGQEQGRTAPSAEYFAAVRDAIRAVADARTARGAP